MRTYYASDKKKREDAKRKKKEEKRLRRLNKNAPKNSAEPNPAQASNAQDTATPETPHGENTERQIVPGEPNNT